MSQRPRARKNVLEYLLNLFAEVNAGEGVAVVLMTINIFLILSAYYVLKVVRETLTIGGVSIFGLEGAEIKTYLPALMTFLLIGIVPAYGAIASLVSRLRLIVGSLLTVVLFLAAFAVWGLVTGPGTAIGLSFYVFLGIVNVFLIAQFWSYANDIYDETQGKRLFAIIAVGQSLGAVLGPLLAKLGTDNVFVLLGATSVIFVLAIGLYVLVNNMMGTAASTDDSEEKVEEKPLEKGGGFKLIFTNRYLLLIALMILITNVVNTTGEYILANAAETKAETEASVAIVVDDLAEQYREPGTRSEVPEAWASYFASLSQTEVRPGLGARVEAQVAAETLELSEDQKTTIKAARSPIIGEFYSDFFFFVNLAGLLIQMFVVSRIFKFFGVRAALFVLPVVALGGYAAIGVIGGMLVLRVAKTAENSLDYSLQNTVKQTLFLPTSREAKYKAKAAIDTFFVRFGDVASAIVVAVGLNVLSLGATSFAFINVGLCVAWIGLNVLIAREHKKIASE